MITKILAVAAKADYDKKVKRSPEVESLKYFFGIFIIQSINYLL